MIKPFRIRILRAGPLSFALLVLLTVFGHAQGLTEIEGVVHDPTGASVAHAEVRLISGKSIQKTFTAADGSFRFTQVQASSGTLEAQAPGFSPLSQSWTAGEDHLTLVLPVAPVTENVTVTARSPVALNETTGSVSVLSGQQFENSGSFSLDDALRLVPGFSLFRRSGSLSSNPTSQGVSLRAVGASGASRALVLLDGIPMDDPFGGWVYWSSVPRVDVDRVEVSRGGESSLYGSDALGGVVSIQTRKFVSSALSAETFMGSSNTPSGSMVGSLAWGAWNTTFSGEAFRTGGYVPVDEAERGPVDDVASAEHGTGSLRIARSLGSNGGAFLEGSLFGESRRNGTVIQRNGTTLRQLSTGADWNSPAAGAFSLRVFGGTENFRQNFTSISIDRTIENLIRNQHVPVNQIGGSFQWSRSLGAHYIVAGVDTRNVDGQTDEIAINNLRPTSRLLAGGRQSTVGVFGEDLIRLSANWLLTASGRIDHWRNLDASSLTIPFSSAPTSLVHFPDRSESAFSPRLGLLRRLGHNVTVSASGYRAFRAPTLNELYRGFRVGNVNTLANANLVAERLTGAEASLSTQALSGRLSLRTTYFWNQVHRPVGNITLSVTPALITRQRQNIGRTRAQGVELEGRLRVNSRLFVSAGYQFADARVDSFPGNPGLVGLLLPQVPRHQFTTEFTYTDPQHLTIALQVRYLGQQFDDDQNLLPLEAFFNLDASVSHPLGRGVEIFGAAENVFNSRYSIGRTPVRTIAAPTLARIGLRFQLGEAGRPAP